MRFNFPKQSREAMAGKEQGRESDTLEAIDGEGSASYMTLCKLLLLTVIETDHLQLICSSITPRFSLRGVLLSICS